MVRFQPIDRYRPGAVSRLLLDSYATLISRDIHFWPNLKKDFNEFDAEVFENPETVGKCVFITCVDGHEVGLGSYDPRQRPDRGIIGHHCVLPQDRRRGIGRLQIEEILRRFREMGILNAVVSTSEHPFFLPARRTYSSAGFVEVCRKVDGTDPRYKIIEYSKQL